MWSARVTLTPDSKLQFTPTPDYNGPADFTYTITDGLTVVQAKVHVDVTPVNDPPIANPDNVSTLEDIAITIPVRSNDTDIENDPLTVTAVTQGARGTVVIDPVSGNPVYTPNAGATGTDTFRYTISDGKDGTASTTVTVNIGAVNKPPVANPDTGTTNEDSVLVRSAAEGVILGAPGTDTDPDGNTLTVSRVSFGATSVAPGAPISGSFGTLTLNADGSYSYAPAPQTQAFKAGQVENDVFVYTVADPSGLVSSTTLTIRITGVNDGPVAIDDSAATPEDTPVVITVLRNDTDPENDPLTVTQINGQPISTGNPVALTDAVKNLPIGVVSLNTDGTLTFTSGARLQRHADLRLHDQRRSADQHRDRQPDGRLGQRSAGGQCGCDPWSGKHHPHLRPARQRHRSGYPEGAAADDRDRRCADRDRRIGAAADGLLSKNADGTLSFLPNTDFTGVVNFGYTLSDGALVDRLDGDDQGGRRAGGQFGHGR